MANYNLVVNSRFQPFSYERYLQPYQQYGEAYKEQENALMELSSRADIWEKLANEAEDSDAYKIYKGYSDSLRNQATKLSQDGLTPTGRQELIDLKRRYSSEIVPLEQAYLARAKQIEEQHKASMQNSSLMYDRDAASTSIDEYLHNPNLTYKSVSGNDLAAQVGEAVANYAKVLRDPGKKGAEARQTLKRLLPYQYEYIEKHGLTEDELLDIITGDEGANPVITQIINNVVENSGVGDWNRKGYKEKAWRYARRGAYKGLGTDTPKYLTDTYNMNNQLQEDAISLKNSSTKSTAPTSDDTIEPFTEVPSFTHNEEIVPKTVESDSKDIIKFMEHPDLLNEKGIAVVRTQLSSAMTPNLTAQQTRETRPNLELLKKIAPKYGMLIDYSFDGTTNKFKLKLFDEKTGMQLTESQIKEKLDNYKQTALVSNKEYMLNLADNKFVKDRISTAGWNLFKNGQNVIRPIENGRIGKQITDEGELAEYLNGSDMKLIFNPNLGYIIQSTSTDGKKVKFGIINPYTFDIPKKGSTLGYFAETYEHVQSLLKKQKYEEAKKWIDIIGKALYNHFQKVNPVPSTTSSKAGPLS